MAKKAVTSVEAFSDRVDSSYFKSYHDPPKGGGGVQWLNFILENFKIIFGNSNVIMYCITAIQASCHIIDFYSQL